jgi:hypothetical protein
MANEDPQDERGMLEQIGVPRTIEDPTLFDLLGVPPDCEDDQAINKAGRERDKLLGRWETQRTNLVAQKLAIALKRQVSSAQRRLRTVEGRREYRKELQEQRAGRFRERIRSALTPGEEPNASLVARLLQTARSFGIDEKAARQVIQDLTRVDNPFAGLGLMPIPGDGTWPTAFDLLALEETDSPPPDVAQRAAAQRQKVEALLRAGKVDSQQANKLRTYVEEAQRTLGSPELTKTYRRGLVKRRAERFAKTIELVGADNLRRDSSALIQIVHQGRQMRLTQAQVEQLVAKVTGVKVSDLISSHPALVVGRSSIEAFVRGDGTGSVETLSIRNDGTGKLEVHLEASAPWMKLSSCDLTTETRCDVTVTFLPSMLRPGEPLTGSIWVRSNGGDAEIAVSAMLGASGSAATQADYNAAAVSYRLAMGSLLFFPFVVLTWRFMMSRKESSFQAFHALQAMVVAALDIVAIIIIVVSMVPFADKGSPPTGPGTATAGCAGYCFVLVAFPFIWLGIPWLLASYVQQGWNLQIPGVAPLLRKLL